jgi:pyruvate,orthophosphate dikinase
MANTTAFTFDATHAGKKVPDLKPRLGGKGANLWHMTRNLGLPVPQGFTICTNETFLHEGKTALRNPLANRIDKLIGQLEQDAGRRFGDLTDPLLVSVRSGAAISMPGMMETVLNLGMNREVTEALSEQVDERWAWDSYRRFIQMYGTIVLDMPAAFFADRQIAAQRFYGSDKLDVEFLQLLVNAFLSDTDVPDDPREQLHGAILAVFRSWFGDKANKYREIEGIPADLGTAVNVQRMVFGNLTPRSGTGVAFTRNPNTGEREHYGDFLAEAQGEDVVDGSCVTSPLADMTNLGFPEAHEELTEILNRLDAEYGDMCDVEFTIEDNELYILQTRIGKRAPQAERRIVVDLLADGTITAEQAHERLENIWGTAQPTGDTGTFTGVKLGEGLAASPGVAVGAIVTSSQAALDADGPVILCRPETSPEDVDGMSAAVGILTAKGGAVSHAAVVARSWGKPCVVGFDKITVLPEGITFDGQMYPAGTMLRIDGSTGVVEIASDVPTSEVKSVPATHYDVVEGDVLFIPAGTKIDGYTTADNVKVRVNMKCCEEDAEVEFMENAVDASGYQFIAKGTFKSVHYDYLQKAV